MALILEIFTAAATQTKYAIAPLALMALAQGIPFVINTVKGISQARQAKKLAETPRPQYEIPDALIKSVNNAKYISSMRELPGQNVMEGRIGQNLSRGIQDLKDVSSSPSELAANVSRMYAGSNNAINDIGMAAGQNWMNNQAGFRQALNQLGDAQNTQWQLNKFDPYANDMAASSALREGSFRNISAAGQNLASGLSGYGNMKYQEDQLKSLLESLNSGGGTGVNTGTPNAGMGMGTFISPFVDKSRTSVMGGGNNGVSNLSLGEAYNSTNATGGIDIDSIMKYLQSRSTTTQQ